MPAVYDLINDYGTGDINVSMAPVWVLAVVRWAHPFLWDRVNLKTNPAIDAFQEASEPLVITSDCIQVQVVASKRAHVANLSATLKDNAVNYLSSVYPDDWLMCWFLPNETRAKALIKRIRAGKACNGFLDGLKFFGRVNTCFKDTSVDDGGRPLSAYNLTGVGFGEFDYTLFWEPMLATSDSLPVWYQRLGIALNAVVTGSDKSMTDPNDPYVIDVNKMIPSLVRLTLGEGPFKNGNISLPGGASASVNGGVRVPPFVGKLMGKSNNAQLTYSDLVDILVGVQKYKGAAGAAQNTPAVFVPDGIKRNDQPVSFEEIKRRSGSLTSPFVASYLSTGIDLMGGFPLVQLPFQDTPIWGILEQFLNPGVNEMFIALKPDETGNVMPRLTLRQYPFSSLKYAGAHKDIPLTTYFELPRWRIDRKLLKHIQVGRSNALRKNFVHIQGTGPGVAISPQQQYVDHPPLTDRRDIERSGMRRMFQTVNTTLIKGPRGIEAWQQIVADMTMGQHLTLTGTIQTVGIIQPIAPGDNITFANIIYHVESVTHAGTIDPGGRRRWTTSLQVTQGIADEDSRKQNIRDTKLDPPLEEYAGVRNADPVTEYVGRTVLDQFEE